MNKTFFNLYPNGKNNQEDVISAVLDATRAIFTYGLDPEACKIALITLRGYIDELLEPGEDDDELFS
ncbi:MAG: hypothetical protein Q8M92_11020 [Candidatus Subteraquimicrobiales bacterium]|nr:hypothetical protein [Candidatus Subteraquimicrobiales bacterium]